MADNTVTFYQKPTSLLSMRALPMVVLVDGLPAPWLEPLEIIRRGGPQLNEAWFHLSGHPEASGPRFQHIAWAARPGQSIEVGLVCNVSPASRQQLCWPLFVGTICRGKATLEDKDESVRVLARDSVLHRPGGALDGIRALRDDGTVVYIRSEEVVFNPDGKGNASGNPVQVNSRAYHVFDVNHNTAAYWTYASAFRYVVSEYIGTVDIFSDCGLDAVAEMTSGQTLRDVDVTGMDPLAAIGRLCQRAGLTFCIECVLGADGKAVASLKFQKRLGGKKVHLRHQENGAILDLAQTNLSECSLDTVEPRESIRLVGRGDKKRFEATFDLVGGWDPSLETNDYDVYSPSTNPDFFVVQDVFRKWVLNEAGDYSGAPYNRGMAYDLSKVLGEDSYCERQRRFWPCLSRSVTGRSLGYYLEVSLDDGESWQPYAGAFDNLLDQCGIYLNCNQFAPQTWVAIQKGKLCFRITATIVGDEPLQVVLNDVPIEAARPVRTVIVDLGREFKYRQVTPQSILHNLTGTELGPPDNIDDQELMRGRLRDYLVRERQVSASGTATLPWIQPDIWPDDRISQISGRNVDLGHRRGSQDYAPQVETVKLHFGSEWTTQIEFGGG